MQLLKPDNPKLTATLGLVPDGREGTIATLRIMRQLVRAGKTALPVRTQAVMLTRGLAQKDYSGEARALFNFVQNSIRYVKDITDVETLHRPDEVLSLGCGDCDDKSILLASLLESIGHPTRFIAIGPDNENFVHVFVETKIGSNWISMDATENEPCGWRPSGYPARLVIHN